MTRDQLKIIVSVATGLCFLLVPFSRFIGWNIFTLLLFWIVLVPLLTLYLPNWVAKKKNTLIESLIGMGIFYALMVFMIYDHYKTDYFKLMLLSSGINLITITVTHFIAQQGKEVKNTSHKASVKE